MSILNQVRDRVIKALPEGFDLEKLVLEHPTEPSFGDYSTNVALVLKGGRKMAEEIAGKIGSDEVIEKVEVAGPGFINIWLQTECLIKELQTVLNLKDGYGRRENIGKTAVVDYSAPNIAKPFGIGHLRSTIIGQAIYNLLEFRGYKVVGDNHLGDWGTQFGKLLYMIEMKKDPDLSIEKLEAWYVEFHKLSESNPEMENEARNWFVKLEKGDEVAVALWQKCVDISMEEYRSIYELLKVKIDYAYGESFYQDMMPEIIFEAKEKGLAHTSEGALVVDVDGFETPLMLAKSDGASTYATRDMATIKYRTQTWNPDLIVYEVGNEQTLHFQQVFAAVKKFGYVKPNTQLVHTRHGLYLAPDGKKFSTRKGKTVKLDEVLYEAVEKAHALGEMNEETARDVGIGAVKYFDLSHNIQSDIVFDWETILALSGNSGPYLQYAYARTQSILEKYAQNMPKSDEYKNYRTNLVEIAVLKYIYQFDETLELATSRLHPHLLGNYLYGLAQSFNAFYAECSILSADTAESLKFRIMLTAAVGQILKNGLRLLGLETPDKL